MQELHLRMARQDDVAELLRMIRELAEHEGELPHVLTDERELGHAGFGTVRRYGALVAEVGERLVGFVTFTWHYAIWRGATAMHIDDVYVRDSHRGQGVGRAMMQFARTLAAQAGAVRLRWEAKPGNEGGLRFYRRLGAETRLKNVFVWATDG